MYLHDSAGSGLTMTYDHDFIFLKDKMNGLGEIPERNFAWHTTTRRLFNYFFVWGSTQTTISCSMILNLFTPSPMALTTFHIFSNPAVLPIEK